MRYSWAWSRWPLSPTRSYTHHALTGRSLTAQSLTQLLNAFLHADPMTAIHDLGVLDRRFVLDASYSE